MLSAVRELGQCETPAYRLLCGGGGWCWLQTRAGLSASRRGTTRATTLTCSHAQLSGVEQPGTVLAALQSSPAPPQPSGVPTSVIVRRRPAESATRVSTESIFSPKPQEPESTKERREPDLLAAVTEKIFARNATQPTQATVDSSTTVNNQDMEKKKDILTVSTESIFSQMAVSTESIFHRKPQPEPEAPVGDAGDFFEELFSQVDPLGLEQLAPHSGGHCVPLTSSLGSEAGSPPAVTAALPGPQHCPALQDLVTLELAQPDIFLYKELLGPLGGAGRVAASNPSPARPPARKRKLETSTALLDPDRDAMWGGGGGVVSLQGGGGCSPPLGEPPRPGPPPLATTPKRLRSLVALLLEEGRGGERAGQAEPGGRFALSNILSDIGKI